jgi:chromosome segregation ATPase
LKTEVHDTADSKLQKAKTDLENLSRELEAKDSTIESLEQELSTKKTKIIGLKVRAESCEKQVASLSTKLAESEGNVLCVQMQMDATLKDSKIAQSRGRQAAQRLKEASSEIEHLKRQLSESETNIMSLEHEKMQIDLKSKANQHELSTNYALLLQESTELRSQLEDNRSRLLAIQAQDAQTMSTSASSATTYRFKLQREKRKVETLVEQRNKLQEEKNELERRNDFIKDLLKEKDELIADMQQRIEESNKSVLVLQTNLHKTAEKLRKLEELRQKEEEFPMKIVNLAEGSVKSEIEMDNSYSESMFDEVSDTQPVHCLAF